MPEVQRAVGGVVKKLAGAVELLPDVYREDKLIEELVESKRLRFVPSGSDLPVIDLSGAQNELSPELLDEAGLADFVVLEGMGRSIETNLYADLVGVDTLRIGMVKHEEDFGQTLAVWKVDPGPYLVLPIFGPSNPRDAVGLVTDTLIDPFTWTTPKDFRLGVTVTRAVDKRARNFDAIDDLQKNSLDPYAAIRSLYRQRRMDEIRNGAPSAITPVPGGISATPDRKTSPQQSQETGAGN